MSEFLLKTGDSRPVFQTTLGDDIQGYSEVRIYVEVAGTDTLVVNDEATVVDETTGEIEYDFSPEQTAREGYHVAEVVVNYASDDKQSYPNDGFYTFEFNETLNRSGDIDPAEASGSVTVADLTTEGDIKDDAGNIVYDYSRSLVPQSILENDTVTVAGNSVALGGSTSVSTDDLTEGGANLFHTDERAQDAVGTILDGTLTYNDGTPSIGLTNDSVTVSAGNKLTGGGTVALGGSVSIDLDEAGSFNWTDEHTFSGGLTAGSTIDLQNTYQISNAPSPVDADDLARKQYVDNNVSGATDVKESVTASPTGNIDLTVASDPNPVDGVNLTDGQRVLLKSQTDATENGIYVATTAADPTTWVRADDADSDAEVTSGLFVFVEEGTANGDSSFIITTADPITLGVTEITFSQFSSAGEIIGGDGLTKSGQTLNINVTDFAGAFLSNDGSQNLQVDIGRGLEDDGAGNIRFDEDTGYTFTTTQEIEGDLALTDAVTEIRLGDPAASTSVGVLGATSESDLRLTTSGGGGSNNSVQFYDSANAQLILEAFEGGNVDILNGDLTDGTNVIYDQSNSWVPQSRLENDSLTVTAGTQLTGGGSVALGGSITLNVDEAALDTKYVEAAGDSMEGEFNLNDNPLTLRNAGDLNHKIVHDSGLDGFSIEGFGGVQLRETDTGTNMLVANSSGLVEIPNGDLDVSSTGLFNDIELTEEPFSAVIETFSNSVSHDGSVFRGERSMNFNIDTVNSNEGFRSFTFWADAPVPDSAGAERLMEIFDGGTVEIPSGDLSDGANVIYDQSNSWVPQERLENDSLTVTAGNQLTGGGSVALGGSITLDVDEAALDSKYVDAAGDTMTGTLDLQDNQLVDVSRVNIGGVGTGLDTFVLNNDKANGVLRVVDENNDTLMGINHAGPVDILNANLSLNNNLIIQPAGIRFNNSEFADIPDDNSLAYDASEGGNSNGGFIYRNNGGIEAYLVNSTDGDYNIEKNGTDEVGSINFKTA